MAAARKWCTAQRIVVGHANHATVTTGDLLALAAGLAGAAVGRGAGGHERPVPVAAPARRPLADLAASAVEAPVGLLRPTGVVHSLPGDGAQLALIAERGLRTVTLADVWATPTQRLRGSTATGRVAVS